MSDNPVTERDAIARHDWDIPVTDEFVQRVRRGVRYRMWRRAATGGAAALAAAGTAVTVGVLAGGPAAVRPAAPSPSPSLSVVAPSVRALDGFTIGYVPAGARPVGADSIFTTAVGPEGPLSGAPAPGQPGVAVTMRRFDRAVGEGLFVSVLRPSLGAGSATTADQVGEWMHQWNGTGGEPVRSFDTPIGPATLVANRGTESTAYEVTIRAAGGVVVSVSGAGSYSVDEMEKVARGITG